MPKIAVPLRALEVARLTEPGFHMVGTVPGLALRVTAAGARSWVLRVTMGNKRRDMGLGAYPAVTLALAHEKARNAREAIDQGHDPILERERAQSALRAAQAAALTFDLCATAFIEANRAGWSNAKHAQQWTNTLKQWASPKLGRLLVRDIGLTHILAVLQQPAEPTKPEGPNLWIGKTETANRVRGRIEQVLDWAAVRELRDKDNPARWRGNLDKLLPAPERVKKTEHHPAVPVVDVGAFMARLRQAEGIAARALEFTILTAARSGETRGATWAEIDLKTGTWVVPANRMKAKREHRVPLSDAALALLNAAPRLDGTDLVFPSPTSTAERARPLSDMALTAVMRRMGTDAVPHGLRSTFRDWVGERTAYPGDIAEMALAHTIQNKAEAAYRRGDLMDKRRRMMGDWATFLAQPAALVDNVVNIGERAA